MAEYSNCEQALFEALYWMSGDLEHDPTREATIELLQQVIHELECGYTPRNVALAFDNAIVRGNYEDIDTHLTGD